MIKQKDLIIKRFKRNLKFYENEAITQKEMAFNLIKSLIEIKGKSFGKILEIGCGVGVLTKEIVKNLSFKEFFANDIVLECNQYIKKISDKIIFIGGDIEEITIPSGLDLIISNATFQWLNYPEEFFKRIYPSLKEKGILCFSTFGRKNFLELQTLSCPSLEYYDNEEIRRMSYPYFRLKYFEEETKRLYFSSVMDVLNHIKRTGVNGIVNFRWNTSSLDRFKKEYEKNFRTKKGITLTYNPVYYYFERLQE